MAVERRKRSKNVKEFATCLKGISSALRLCGIFAFVCLFAFWSNEVRNVKGPFDFFSTKQFSSISLDFRLFKSSCPDLLAHQLLTVMEMMAMETFAFQLLLFA